MWALLDATISKAKQRLVPHREPWIDFLRGIAVIAMVLFHLSFDLHEFGREFMGGPLPVPDWYWILVPSAIGGTFLALLGVSARMRFLREGAPALTRLRRRGIYFSLIALGINIATIYFFPRTPIYFGILHSAAAAFLLLPFFLAKPGSFLPLGLGAIVVGILLLLVRVDFPWLLWVGLMPKQNAGWDYYPILPWFGVVLLGAWGGGKPLPPEVPRFDSRSLAPIRWLGKNSLLVYVIHQPILLGCLWALGIMRPA